MSLELEKIELQWAYSRHKRRKSRLNQRLFYVLTSARPAPAFSPQVFGSALALA